MVSLLGISSALISAVAVDKIFLGGSKAFIAQIVSDHYEAINQEIAVKLERTTSIIDIVGGYSGSSKKMLMTSFTMTQYTELLNIINHHDPKAFVTVHQAHEINGEGWSY